jgi:hypothetical protein
VAIKLTLCELIERHKSLKVEYYKKRISHSVIGGVDIFGNKNRMFSDISNLREDRFYMSTEIRGLRCVGSGEVGTGGGN